MHFLGRRQLHPEGWLMPLLESMASRGLPTPQAQVSVEIRQATDVFAAKFQLTQRSLAGRVEWAVYVFNRFPQSRC